MYQSATTTGFHNPICFQNVLQDFRKMAMLPKQEFWTIPVPSLPKCPTRFLKDSSAHTAGILNDFLCFKNVLQDFERQQSSYRSNLSQFTLPQKCPARLLKDGNHQEQDAGALRGEKKVKGCPLTFSSSSCWRACSRPFLSCSPADVSSRSLLFRFILLCEKHWIILFWILLQFVWNQNLILRSLAQHYESDTPS